MERRSLYIRAQIYDMSRNSPWVERGAILLGPHDAYAIFPRIPLPARWRREGQPAWSPVLVWFPAFYPEEAPRGFYLRSDLSLWDGSRDSHFYQRAYHDNPDLSEKGWFFYCVLIHGWKPHPRNPLEKDNLWSFMDVVRLCLSSGQKEF